MNRTCIFTHNVLCLLACDPTIASRQPMLPFCLSFPRAILVQCEESFPGLLSAMNEKEEQMSLKIASVSHSHYCQNPTPHIRHYHINSIIWITYKGVFVRGAIKKLYWRTLRPQELEKWPRFWDLNQYSQRSFNFPT